MEQVPATHLDPSVDQSGALGTHISSAVGIDATRPVGESFADVADVPGWQDYKMPELDKWRSQPEERRKAVWLAGARKSERIPGTAKCGIAVT